jgi:hypothetical protein
MAGDRSDSINSQKPNNMRNFLRWLASIGEKEPLRIYYGTPCLFGVPDGLEPNKQYNIEFGFDAPALVEVNGLQRRILLDPLELDRTYAKYLNHKQVNHSTLNVGQITKVTINDEQLVKMIVTEKDSTSVTLERIAL